MSFQQLPYERMIVDSFDELARTLSTRDDVKYLVDTKVRDELFLNYRNRMMKSLSHLVSDDFGVAVIRSDLTELRADEKEFSAWIQSEPLHDATLEEAEAMPTPPTPKEETSPEGAGSPDFQERTEESEKAEAP